MKVEGGRRVKEAERAREEAGIRGEEARAAREDSARREALLKEALGKIEFLHVILLPACLSISRFPVWFTVSPMLCPLISFDWPVVFSDLDKGAWRPDVWRDISSVAVRGGETP